MPDAYDEVNGLLLPMDHLLKEDEVATILSMKVATLRRWRWSGDGPLFIKIGGAVRYRVTDITKFINEGERSSTSDTGEYS